MGAHARASAAKAALVRAHHAAQMLSRQYFTKKKEDGSTGSTREIYRKGISPGGGGKKPSGQKRPTALSPSSKRLAAAARLAKELAVDAAQERKRLRLLLPFRRKGRTSRVRAWVEPPASPPSPCFLLICFLLSFLLLPESIAAPSLSIAFFALRCSLAVLGISRILLSLALAVFFSVGLLALCLSVPCCVCLFAIHSVASSLLVLRLDVLRAIEYHSRSAAPSRRWRGTGSRRTTSCSRRWLPAPSPSSPSWTALTSAPSAWTPSQAP
jgi:hypothetical protein